MERNTLQPCQIPQTLWSQRSKARCSTNMTHHPVYNSLTTWQTCLTTLLAEDITLYIMYAQACTYFYKGSHKERVSNATISSPWNSTKKARVNAKATVLKIVFCGFLLHFRTSNRIQAAASSPRYTLILHKTFCYAGGLAVSSLLFRKILSHS